MAENSWPIGSGGGRVLVGKLLGGGVSIGFLENLRGGARGGVLAGATGSIESAGGSFTEEKEEFSLEIAAEDESAVLAEVAWVVCCSCSVSFIESSVVSKAF